MQAAGSMMVVAALLAQAAKDPRVDRAAIILAVSGLVTAAVPIVIKAIDAGSAFLDHLLLRSNVRHLLREKVAELEEKINELTRVQVVHGDNDKATAQDIGVMSRDILRLRESMAGDGDRPHEPA